MWILLDISKQWLVKSVFVKPELGKDHGDVGEKIHDYHCFPSKLGKKERLAVWTMIPRFQESMRGWYGWPNIFCVELEIPNTLKRLDNSVCLDSLVLCTCSHSARGWRDIQTHLCKPPAYLFKIRWKIRRIMFKNSRPTPSCDQLHRWGHLSENHDRMRWDWLQPERLGREYFVEKIIISSFHFWFLIQH